MILLPYRDKESKRFPGKRCFRRLVEKLTFNRALVKVKDTFKIMYQKI